MKSILACILCLIAFTSVSIQETLKCGLSQNSLRIVGGNETNKLQYPWMAFMSVQHVAKGTNTTNHLIRCDASLIDDQWLVTAAHCFNEQINSTLIAVNLKLGAHNISVREPLQVDIKADKHIVHPLYNHLVASKHDIAMVKLSQKLDLTGKHKYLQPICLPEVGLSIRSNDCYITGWGRTTSTGKDSSVLKQAKITLITSEECKKVRAEVDNTEVCAGTTGVSTCRGDSGGPLQCPLANGIWVIEGITSYGRTNCGSSVPSVFTKVESFLQWINKTRTEN